MAQACQQPNLKCGSSDSVAAKIQLHVDWPYTDQMQIKLPNLEPLPSSAHMYIAVACDICDTFPEVREDWVSDQAAVIHDDFRVRQVRSGGLSGDK